MVDVCIIIPFIIFNFSFTDNNSFFFYLYRAIHSLLVKVLLDIGNKK
jgi:hypothetical protein